MFFKKNVEIAKKNMKNNITTCLYSISLNLDRPVLVNGVVLYNYFNVMIPSI